MKMLKSLSTAIATLTLFYPLTPIANAGNDPITPPIIISEAITGGWSSVAPNEPAVQKAAENALLLQAKKTGESLTLLSVNKAKRQVVAGMNYELILEINRDGETATARVIVWAKLDGSYQLTEWWWKA